MSYYASLYKNGDELKPMESKYKSLVFWRSKARLLFRILLAIGFLVQSWKFLEMYLQYPATVELEVLQPSEVEMPAFTVCNINEIRSTPYCEKYPKKCGTPESDETFCKRFAEYCNLVNNSRVVPLFNGMEEFRNLSRREQQDLGHQFKDLVTSCTVEMDDKELNCTGEPVLVPALSFSYEVPFNCFMMYSLFKKPDAEPKKIPVSTKIRLKLNLEVSQYHPSHLSRGGQISIHSPNHVPSPVGEGLFLNMGTIYRIYVRMAEKILLPHPYRSNCTNYVEQWKKNGGTGPVTEKMCKEMCKLQTSLEEYGCVERRIDYPHNYTICQEAKNDFAKKNRYRCAKSCSTPCNMKRYELEVQEANSEGTRGSCVTATDLSCATLVDIVFENLEITTFTYTPRFEPIGILSFIGGYVGLWLGISLLKVYDFLETRLFRLLAASKRRWKRGNHRVSAAPENAKGGSVRMDAGKDGESNIKTPPLPKGMDIVYPLRLRKQ